MSEKSLRAACVLGGDHVGFLKHLQRAKSDITQIPYRSRHYPQPTRYNAIILCQVLV
jgi:hypothetical protein